MSTTEEVLDDLTEIVEETAELAGDIHAWRCGLSRKQHAIQIIVVGAIAGGIGGVVAYYIGKKFMKAKYEKIAEKEIAEAKAFYSILNKKDELSTPGKAVASLHPVTEASNALLKYQGAENSEDDENDEEEGTDVVEGDVNVFTESNADNDFDIEEEMKYRTPDNPYIISQEEFLQAETEFQQTTITYYEGDGTLADERDQEIPFVDPVVGEENLQQFGHGSGDSRVVYIRNERLSTDFEVLKSDGKYAYEVLGLEHFDGTARDRQRKNQPRKFRGGD